MSRALQTAFARIPAIRRAESTVRRRAMASQSGSVLVKTPIPLFGIDGRYATALYSAAAKQSKLEAVDGDLQRLRQLIKTDTPFRDFLLNPLVKPNAKKDVIRTLATKIKMTDLTVNLIGVLAENGRIKLLAAVGKQFNRVMAISRGEMEATVTTAKALDETAKREVEESLKGFAKGKKLSLTLKVDPTILGGMIVDFAGEHYIDMSIRSKFNFYKNILRQAV